MRRGELGIRNQELECSGDRFVYSKINRLLSIYSSSLFLLGDLMGSDNHLSDAEGVCLFLIPFFILI